MTDAGRDAATRPGLEQKLEALPARPGVYLLRDPQGRVIYVGKAKSLRSRVRSYFRGGDERAQVRFLVQRVADVEILVTQNDKEALILENNLIKQYRPRYNVRLKDDKSYVSVKVTLRDEWPRILVTRRIVDDGGRYFGPFASAQSVRETLKTIRRSIPLRTCTDGVFRNRSRPCLEYQIKRCLAPCCLPVSRQAYQEHLAEAMLLLEGKSMQLVRELRARMQRAAEDLRFEEAAVLRDRLRAIERTQERQEVVSHRGGDADVFGIYREGGFIEVQVLFVRNGKMTGNQAYQVVDLDFPDEEVLAAVLTQFYEGERPIPSTVLVPVDLEDREAREEYLGEKRGRSMEILRPQRGHRLRLLEMAVENARESYRSRRDGGELYDRTSAELQRRLQLRSAPRRIECFDISNIHGTNAVGSMVTFDQGEPDKARYRRFRVRTVEGSDDFAMMHEVLRRRIARGKEEGDLPDLLVVDGGKGQLNVALAVLRELEVDTVDAVGLAKSRLSRDARARELTRSEERVFLPGRKNPVVLSPRSNALFLLQRVRDEAHRFAVTYHRKLRGKGSLGSLLDDIPGVGPERRRRILRAFGSVRRVSEATVADLAAVPGIGPELARAVYETLRNAADGRQGGGENAEPLPMETEPEPTPTVPESEVVRNGR